MFSPTCQGFQSTCCFNDPQIFCPTPCLIRSLAVSLGLYLLHQLPFPSARLPFMTCHYIHFKVCLQNYPCLVFHCLHPLLILFYRFLSSCLLIPAHWDWINQKGFSFPAYNSSDPLLSSLATDFFFSIQMQQTTSFALPYSLFLSPQPNLPCRHELIQDSVSPILLSLTDWYWFYLIQEL